MSDLLLPMFHTVDILYDDFSDAMNIWNMTEQRTSRPSHMAYTDSSIQNADVTSSDDDTNIQSLFNSSNDSMSQI